MRWLPGDKERAGWEDRGYGNVRDPRGDGNVLDLDFIHVHIPAMKQALVETGQRAHRISVLFVVNRDRPST